MFEFLKNRKRVIRDRDSNEPYLVRWYLFLKDRKNFPFNVTLHKVLKSDEPVLHDHPWNWGAIILKGGYYEHIPIYSREGAVVGVPLVVLIQLDPQLLQHLRRGAIGA